MSRATRAVAASTKAHSRRCASATAALTSRSAASGPSPVTQRSPCRAGHVHDRPHLDAAERRRAELCDLEGVIEIAGLDQVVAAERLLGLGERRIVKKKVADGGGGAGRLQRVAAEHLAALLADLLREPPVRLPGRLPDFRPALRVAALALIDQDQVLAHRGVSFARSIWSDTSTTNDPAPDRQGPPEILSETCRRPPQRPGRHAGPARDGRGRTPARLAMTGEHPSPARDGRGHDPAPLAMAGAEPQPRSRWQGQNPSLARD